MSDPQPKEPGDLRKTTPEHTDGRPLGDWTSHFPPEARKEINFEAWTLGSLLVVSLIVAGGFLGAATAISEAVLGPFKCNVSNILVATFATGVVGGTTFSIKWLVHTVAKGTWHLDRRYWRFLTPAIGGVYACAVLALFKSGLFGAETIQGNPYQSVTGTAALAFLVGYFSDGVSGLLSNVANAVFGTLEKK
jgi:hypothetical protein